MIFAVVLISCSAIFCYIGFRAGSQQANRKSSKLVSHVMRELEFRDDVRSESRKGRLVTRSAHEEENGPGRSRVRSGIKPRKR